MYLPEVSKTTHFVAREDKLQKMQDTLAGTDRRRCVVLQGLGGMGKKQLALTYIRRHQLDHTAVIWFKPRTKQQSFRACRSEPCAFYNTTQRRPIC